MTEKSKNRMWDFCCIFILVLGVVVLNRFAFLKDSLAVRGDGLAYFAYKSLFVDGLRNGELPFWNPYTAIGTPFWADVQQTVLSPFNIFYLFTGKVLAYNLSRLSQLVAAAIFMYLLIREETQKREVALVMGLIYATATMMGGRRIEHITIVGAISMFPAIMYFLTKYKKTGVSKWLWLSSLAFAIQFYLGFTQTILYFGIAMFVYLLYIFRVLHISLKEQVKRTIQWGTLTLAFAAAQLFPTIGIMLASGRNNILWEAFSVLSYDWRILPMMFLPTVYRSFFQPFDDYSSSGIDIEIYLGILCCIYLIYGVWYQWRDSRIKIWGGIGLGSFLWGMVGNIPYVGRLAYHIPILGSFRVAARSMPVFLFFCLLIAGLAMAGALEKDNIKRLIKVNGYLVAILVILALVVGGILTQPFLASNSELGDYVKSLKRGLFIAIGLCVVHELMIIILDRYHRQGLRVAVVLLCGILIVGDVSRFSFVKGEDYQKLSNLIHPGLPDGLQELLEEESSKGCRNFSLLTSPEQLNESSFPHSAKFVNALYYHTMTYNSYLTFLDNHLSYWGIKETALYPYFAEKIREDNGLLSMLGIKYLLPEGRDINVKVPDEAGERKLVFCEDDVTLSTGDYSMFVHELERVEANKYYLIEVKTNDRLDTSRTYIDLYADTYDNPEQNGSLSKAGDGLYSSLIPTQEIPPDTPIFLRIVSENDISGIIDRIDVYEVEVSDKYKAIDFEETRVYVNENAAAILHTPQRVIGVEGFGADWREDGLEAVDANSYVEGLEGTWDNPAQAEISDIEIGLNHVSARVRLEDRTFINHAQLWYPGWNAYVDGKKTSSYKVNNLIQGAWVPEGDHILEFRYEPWDIYAGVLVSGVSFVLFAIFYIKMKWVKKRSR